LGTKLDGKDVTFKLQFRYQHACVTLQAGNLKF
jgi:hypothetical protein